GVEPAGHLYSGAAMKIHRQLIDALRTAIAAAVGNQYAIFITKRLHLRIEWIDLIAPAAVQENQRVAVSGFAIMNRHRRRAGNERRFVDVRERHARSIVRDDVANCAASGLWYSLRSRASTPGFNRDESRRNQSTTNRRPQCQACRPAK